MPTTSEGQHESEDESEDESRHVSAVTLEACASDARGDRFVGVYDPKYEHTKDPNACSAPSIFAEGHQLDCLRDDLLHDGYDPVHGFGTEASRPPDYDDPDDEVAYPHGPLGLLLRVPRSTVLHPAAGVGRG